MRTVKCACFSIVLIIVLLCFGRAYSCSTYKITIDGITYVGSNYDTWLISPRIWFETEGIAAAFTGARNDGAFGYAPQTGMNDSGLVFVSLAVETPDNSISFSGKKPIASRTLFLKDILHHCSTVEEVKSYMEQYDRSLMREDIFMYADKSGKVLVVEPLQNGN